MRPIFFLSAACVVASCGANVRPITDASVPTVPASAETAAVKSLDDAADDPAIFVPSDPSQTRILGTDKQAGLYVYALDGSIMQFLEVGRLNNVDLRQTGDTATVVASNRSNNSVALFVTSVEATAFTGSFPAVREEPYGICMAAVEPDAFFVAVTHKSGEVDVYSFRNVDGSDAEHMSTTKLGEQLEGCVFDEENGSLFVGREEGGIERFDYEADGMLSNRTSVDIVDGRNGIVADIEGLAIYRGDSSTEGFLLASSQGNNTFAVYSRNGDEFVGRFSIGPSSDGTIDGAEETDGIAVSSASLPGYPQGILVVQDGFNDPASNLQNFKIVSWEDITVILGSGDSY